MTNKQTPLTLEVFQEILMPQIKLLILDSETSLEEKFNEKIKHLPTNDKFSTEMSKVVGELQKLREEVVITGHHYKKTNKRVDIIDKHLGIDTSVVF